MAPKTHISKHHGPTNKKLRVHLPLIVPNDDDDGTNKDGDTDTTTKSIKKSCRLRVGDDIINVTEGKCYIFDDSLEHEAWNDHSNQARIVLIFDIWHPDLTKKEIKFLSFLRKAEMKLEKKLCKLAAANDHNLTKDDGDSNNNNKKSIEEENKANENFFQILEKARDLKIEPSDLWGVYDLQNNINILDTYIMFY